MKEKYEKARFVELLEKWRKSLYDIWIGISTALWRVQKIKYVPESEEIFVAEMI